MVISLQYLPTYLFVMSYICWFKPLILLDIGQTFQITFILRAWKVATHTTTQAETGIIHIHTHIHRAAWEIL